jgi:hypothetical protein
VIEKSVMDILIGAFDGLKPKAAYADYDLLSGDQALLVIDRAVEPGIAGLDLDWTEDALAQPPEGD